MKSKGLSIVGLVLLVAMSVQGQVPIPDPLPAFDFTFLPAVPTADQPIQLQISGLWPNTCPPIGGEVVVNGNEIVVILLLPGALGGEEPVCEPILTGYGVNVQVGPLPLGVYNVHARVVSRQAVSDTWFLGTIGVGIPVGDPEPPLRRTVAPGDLVVLLQDLPDIPDGPRAGQVGIVICCDTVDCTNRLWVSWFPFIQGVGTSEDCVDRIPMAYQPASATWVDPAGVGLAIPFNQCGFLRQDAEGCFLLEADDGGTYVLVAGAWLPDFLGPEAEFQLGDYVRVRGLINIMRPEEMFFRCREMHGDIFHPVIMPCIPVADPPFPPDVPACCPPQDFRPGDRVRLLVDNPPDMAGRPAPNLMAGRLGTVICCNTTDPEFTVFVSWDDFTGGFDTDFLCNTPMISYPAGSGWWVSCESITRLVGVPDNDVPECPEDTMLIGFGPEGIRIFRDPRCPPIPRTFAGCVTVTVQTNFRAALSLRITPEPEVGGEWQGTITPSVIPPGQSNVAVCITATGIDLAAIPPGESFKVAEVVILAVPAP